MSERTAIQESFEKIEGMNCFACAPARLNPSGLNLVFEPTEDGAKTRFHPSKVFQSYPGYLHGGILCTILDETMAYAGVIKWRVLPFTKNLNVQFRLGVTAKHPHTCLSSIKTRTESGFSASAWIEDDRGRRLVTATGDFIIPTVAMAKRMLPEATLTGTDHLFRP